MQRSARGPAPAAAKAHARMSYLEYKVQTVPTGFRKILYLNWPLVLLLTAVASRRVPDALFGGRRDASPWAEPQMKRFARRAWS